MMRNKGITLVALVITVIVLLILAGVALSLITGEEGLFEKTRQSADSYNTASKSEQNTINDLLEMLENVTGNSGGNGENTSTPSNTSSGGSAEEILSKSDGTEYYGKYVTNYKPDGVTDIKWRIFYIGQDPTNTGDNNIYLISDHYVPRSEVPAKNGVTPNAGDSNYTRTVEISNVLNEYREASSIANQNLINIWEGWENNHYINLESDQYRALAYMMDVEIWDKFNVIMNGSKIAEYVIGAPTVLLFFKSYRNPGKWNDNNLNYNRALPIDDDTNLWVPKAQYEASSLGYSECEAAGMWIPGGASYDTYGLRVLSSGWVYDGNGKPDDIGIRPIVCLKSNIQLEPDGTEYKLVVRKLNDGK